MEAPVVELRHVTKRYGTRAVVDDVSFSIPRGAMVALTGRSGSGKSTILKLVAGLDQPTSGEVLLDGRDISGLDDAALSEVRLRRLGMVFQSHNLLPDATIEQNVRLPLDLAGVAKPQAIARVRELLELVGIAPLAEKRPHEVSGGEAQRAAIARALANEPLILLADEPTASLDAENAELVMKAFSYLNEGLGTAVLLVTHDVEVAASVPTRIRIEHGKLRLEKAIA